METPAAHDSRVLSDAETGGEIRALKLAVVVYVVVFGMKLVAWSMTGVMALLAEGLHTLSDIFVSGFLLVAAHWSRRPADERHRFGYGRAQYVGAIVAATLFVSFTSFELFREAIPRLLAHHEAEHSNVTVAIAVLGLSMLIGLAPLYSLLRAKKRGAAAKAQLLELVNDELGLLAALVGTVLVGYGMPMADPIAALVVATIIGVNGIKLFIENLSFLVGRSPDRELMDKVEACARGVPGVLGIHEVRAQVVGEVIQGDLHVVVKDGIPVQDGHAIARAVEAALETLLPNSDFTIHVDPASATAFAPPKADPGAPPQAARS
jgi:ferrous-iron efflux pump FieF